VNRSPTKANGGVTLHEVFYGKKPFVNNFHIFGYVGYIHIPKEQRTKLEAKSMKCIFVGYDLQSKAYHMYDPSKQKIILTLDVVFDENNVGFHHLKSLVPEDFFRNLYSPGIPQEMEGF
jgi:hypothetical protein